MIIHSSDQVSLAPLLDRFPVPKNLGVSAESRIERGRTWSAPMGATRLKTFEMDSGHNPRLGSFEVDLDDCGPMVLDVLIWIKNVNTPSLIHWRSWIA
ncbi:MAG: hypothetical protein WAN26_12570 [Steroidobacteraceae bacterium]